MKATTAVRYCVWGIALASVSFFATIGVVTVAFAPKGAALTPTNTASDIAAWIQAVGSIAAIIGAFLIGERQANRARYDAEDARAKDEKNKQDAQLAVIILLHRFGTRFEAASEPGMYSLRYEWERTLKNNVRAALTAFDAMPLHELNCSARVLAAARIRSAVQSIYDVTASNVEDIVAMSDPDSDAAFQAISDEIETQSLELEDAWTDIAILWKVLPK
ncbi:hypothetical protein [Achromobacter arsenitoxydans]|uniref:Uncharacterized protein n=1 Tax=Achromobacter arsenitoxydans SY8 TaxID=477184 RepID=H0F9L0_9BURK|nr:hypothetical protein [Achromobacter arsenitoxydans]EHK65275.1 hypothetical protein KYC_17312 [Achromobacter arsenitoxydans SY8]